MRWFEFGGGLPYLTWSHAKGLRQLDFRNFPISTSIKGPVKCVTLFIPRPSLRLPFFVVFVLRRLCHRRCHRRCLRCRRCLRPLSSSSSLLLSLLSLSLSFVVVVVRCRCRCRHHCPLLSIVILVVVVVLHCQCCLLSSIVLVSCFFLSSLLMLLINKYFN